jgi:hypothetical protein
MAATRTTVSGCFDLLEKMHWELISNIKGYFCFRFDSHEVLDEFLEICFSNSGVYIKSLIKRFRAIEPGETETPLPDELSGIIQKPFNNKPPTKKDQRSREALLISTLYAAECYKCIKAKDFEGALRHFGAAENFFGFFMGESDLIFGLNSISAMAYSGAREKLKNDPKQAAKYQVKECWNHWQKNQHSYKSKSSFARDMLDKHEVLGSQRVIERWCKEWESEPC